MFSSFLESRKDGLSLETIRFYKCYLNLAKSVAYPGVTGQAIRDFLKALTCTNAGRHAYYRALRAYFNWVYSPKSGFGLNPQDNPMLLVDAPKVEKKILPSFTPEQLDTLIDQTETVRDRAIISLFADSGLRLTEVANIQVQHIDWQHRLIKARCKGNKEGYAPFGARTESLLKDWPARFDPKDGSIWGLNRWGIVDMLQRLAAKTGLPCHAHTFRRTFASILAKRGIDSLHIMRLGRWESIQMVERYTRSVKFDDSLKLYCPPMDSQSDSRS